jgi:hypothetical protein
MTRTWSGFFVPAGVSATAAEWGGNLCAALGRRIEKRQQQLASSSAGIYSSRGETACQRAHISLITMHSDNVGIRRTAMIAKDFFLTKDNNRISA